MIGPGIFDDYKLEQSVAASKAFAQIKIVQMLRVLFYTVTTSKTFVANVLTF